MVMLEARLSAEGLPTAYVEPSEVLATGRIVSRALAAASDDDARVALARSFGLRLIEAWWQGLPQTGAKRFALRPPFEAFPLVDLPENVTALANTIGSAAAGMDIEGAVYAIGLIYTGMLPTAFRGQLGVYYTPPVLTSRLLDQATAAGVDWSGARVLDPACGGGAFLTPVAQRIVAALPGCSPPILIKNIGNRLRGYEIDPFAAWLSQVSLDAVMLPVAGAAGQRLPVVVTVCDSLKRNPPRDRFDLVIGNPPYGRVRLSEADRLRFRRGLYGHANLYGLFIDVALRHAASDGIIAYVTPTSFLAGEYFKNLRTLLASEAPPCSIDFVDVRRGVFDDVLQETLLATYRRGGADTAARIHHIALNGSVAGVAALGSVRLPPDPSQPWLLPRDPSQASLIARLTAMPHRLADWGYAVSTGPLVWNRFKEQLTSRPGRQRFPLVWAEAVTADGRFVFRAEKKNHAPYFEIRRGDEWLMVDKPCVLLQRTTAKEQARRLIAACLPAEFIRQHGAVVVENHLNMIRPIADKPSVAPEVLATFLNSAAADRAFRCVSGSVAVSAYELEALPLPPPTALAQLAVLVGKARPRAEIEAACDRLYSEHGQ